MLRPGHFFLAFSMLFFQNANALSDEIRICGGQPGGGYHKTIEMLSTLAAEESDFDIVNVTTSGSVENRSGIIDQHCDFAIIQADVLHNERFADLRRNIVDSIYLEPIHFLVRREDKKDDINNVIVKGSIHGWRHGSGHYHSAIYLCSIGKTFELCPVAEGDDETMSDEQIRDVIMRRLNVDRDINAVVFTGFPGIDIMGPIIGGGGANLIDTDSFPYRKFEYYNEYTIKAGTYIKGGKRDAKTFATMALLVSTPDLTCSSSFRKLRSLLDRLRQSGETEFAWRSLEDNSDGPIKLAECR